MAIDTAVYVGDFDTTKPPAGDNVSEGDDNLRHIKSVNKASFPLVTGAVTASHTELNTLVGMTGTVISGLQARLRFPSTITNFSVNQTAAVQNTYFQIAGSGLTVTLPTTSTTGDSVWIYALTSLTVARAGGEKINGVASNSTINAGAWGIFVWSGDALFVGWARIA